MKRSRGPVDVQKKLRWKNMYKFAGIVPNLSFFPLIKLKPRIDLEKHKVEGLNKRMWILICRFLSPKDIILTFSVLSKKFYTLSWNEEIIRTALINTLGTVGYDQHTLRIAQKLERSLKGKKLDPYKIMVEDTSDDSNSDFNSTDDEHEYNARKSDSSTDDQQTVKEYLRREEMKARKIRRWEKDYKIAHMKMLYMNPKDKIFCRGNEKEEIEKKIKTQIENIKDEIMKMKRKKALKYVQEDITFWRKLLMYCSIAKCCGSCPYYQTRIDGRGSIIIICPILRKPLCYNCMNSREFRMISAANAKYKYNVDTKYLDKCGIKYLKAPNPYYGEGKMRLYYEKQVKQCIELVKKLKEDDEEEQRKKREQKRSRKLSKEAEIRKEVATATLVKELVVKSKVCANKEEVIEKYISHPYMQRFFEKNKVRRTLAQVVTLINNGKAARLEEEANNRARRKKEEERLLESKMALLGKDKYNELMTYRKEVDPSGVVRKKKLNRRDQIKIIKQKELERRNNKQTEGELLTDLYNTRVLSDSDSSSASSLEENTLYLSRPSNSKKSKKSKKSKSTKKSKKSSKSKKLKNSKKSKNSKNSKKHKKRH
ncbi:unnamed protein product [Moneuplotes crassus]|uniref:Uncharacterized protein n=1 Tax=Euplotes crassus TaxID=5936 RepID=A0AAD1U5Z3_EUPCR|nr:unnamed protein product [Moneuplotes crassus]